MKTKEELLKFYGVEIGKKYKVTKVSELFKNEFSGNGHKYINKEFEIVVNDNTRVSGSLYIKFKNEQMYFHINSLSELDYEEVKEPILTDKEKEYLSAVIKPFKYRIDEIRKMSMDVEHIVIFFHDEIDIWLPGFEKGTMYIGMEENKEYTVEELGL